MFRTGHPPLPSLSKNMLGLYQLALLVLEHKNDLRPKKKIYVFTVT
jgi:hypothetical protein